MRAVTHPWQLSLCALSYNVWDCREDGFTLSGDGTLRFDVCKNSENWRPHQTKRPLFCRFSYFFVTIARLSRFARAKSRPFVSACLTLCCFSTIPYLI